MASPERMDLDYNTSDGESSGEGNPDELQEQTRRLALALGQKWDAAVARKRLELKVDALPGNRARRNTKELMADLRRLRQLSGTSGFSSSTGSGPESLRKF